MDKGTRQVKAYLARNKINSETITAESLQLIINYIDDSWPFCDFEVIKLELKELMLRSTGEYWSD